MIFIFGFFLFSLWNIKMRHSIQSQCSCYSVAHFLHEDKNSCPLWLLKMRNYKKKPKVVLCFPQMLLSFLYKKFVNLKLHTHSCLHRFSNFLNLKPKSKANQYLAILFTFLNQPLYKYLLLTFFIGITISPIVAISNRFRSLCEETHRIENLN